jgi:hypothetical protein
MTRIYHVALLAVPVLCAGLAPGRAATVAAEYTQTNACGWATINNTKPDAQGFIAWMTAYGHSKKYLYGNGNFWPNDAVDSSVPGGLDSGYGDNANVTFYSTHGGSSTNNFVMATGQVHTIDAYNTCTTDIRNPSTGRQWMNLGDKQARIVSFSTCQGLQLTDLAHWDPVADGIHMITGFNDNESDSPSVGGNYAFFGNLAFFGTPMFTVKQAWFMARPSGNNAVVMAYGVNAADAFNRRDNEKFNWSMARLGPRTYRAWAWIK